MKDRFGRAINVGWSDHHIVWIRAAMTLPHAERMAAFWDIGELTGRGYASVYGKARHILREREAAERRSELASRARAYQAAQPGGAAP